MANPIFKFEEAVRQQCKASILIEGLSGSGKSGLALMLGYTLAGNDWTKVFAIDTENKSLPLYRDLPTHTGTTFGAFKVGQLSKDIGFKPSNYLAFRDVAIQNGAEVVIKDSISHAWQYSGGILDLVNEAKKSNTRYAKDSYAAWSDETVMKEKNELMELLRHKDVHVICTVRVKEKMEYSTDEAGKTKLISLGEQQIMQADIKYEPDLVLRMEKPGDENTAPEATVVKSRYAILKKDETYRFDAALMLQLKKYLEEGVDPQVLLEEQRQDYITAINDYLKAKPNFAPIWEKMKETEGFTKEVKTKDMPLHALKTLYLKLITE